MPEIRTQISLPIMPLRFVFDAPARLEMPDYPGSAWRGAFGHALKQTVCVIRGIECEDCLLYRSCAFPYLFKTPPRAGGTKMTRYQTVPVPYLLTIEPRRSPDEYLLGCTLIGDAYRYLPYVVHALQRSGEQGVGSRRQKLVLREVRQLVFETGIWTEIYRPSEPLATESPGCPVLPELPAAVTIDILTPLRLRRAGHLVTPDTFHFRDLFSALLRRVSMLTYFHGESALETDFAGLTQASGQIEIMTKNLRFKDWTRYSSRQKTDMQMGGVVGGFELPGSDLAPFWPYLWIGQWIHAGKGATMGLGHYRISPASLPEPPIGGGPG
jgi:CRISPR-associated endoribonuclease Cas6